MARGAPGRLCFLGVLFPPGPSAFPQGASRAGNVDGDGLDDLLVSDPYFDGDLGHGSGRLSIPEKRMPEPLQVQVQRRAG